MIWTNGVACCVGVRRFPVLVQRRNDVQAGVFVRLLALPPGLSPHGSKMLLSSAQCISD